MADPLATLARLRRLEVAEARRNLAERNAALAAAEARLAAARAAPAAEAAATAEFPLADYAAWLPLGLAERERAARAERHSAGLAGMAREALALRRAAERQVELLREEPAAAAALKAKRKAQALLDEFGRGR